MEHEWDEWSGPRWAWGLLDVPWHPHPNVPLEHPLAGPARVLGLVSQKHAVLIHLFDERIHELLPRCELDLNLVTDAEVSQGPSRALIRLSDLIHTVRGLPSQGRYVSGSARPLLKAFEDAKVGLGMEGHRQQ